MRFKPVRVQAAPRPSPSPGPNPNPSPSPSPNPNPNPKAEPNPNLLTRAGGTGAERYRVGEPSREEGLPAEDAALQRCRGAARDPEA
eukprot:scaffold19531_cov42-Phaeocystis_antarctica.AAC.3